MPSLNWRLKRFQLPISPLDNLYASTVNLPKIREYYENNWANCLPMWARAYKHGTLTYLNDTNNPVETVNNVLKQYVPKTTTMLECLENIFKYLKSLRFSLGYKNYIEL